MTYIKCSGCGEIIEIPDELSGDWSGDITCELTEPYYCDACDAENEYGCNCETCQITRKIYKELGW